jgi:hypothetical protein
MNVIQKAIDAWRHPGETPEQRAHRRGKMLLERQDPPAYLSTVEPSQSSTELADQERDRVSSLAERGLTYGQARRLTEWREPLPHRIRPYAETVSLLDDDGDPA